MDRKMFKILATLIIFVSIIMTTLSYPVLEHGDLEAAASGDEHHGRVQIQVYRGPTDYSGHESYAPWGYWVKQPADD